MQNKSKSLKYTSLIGEHSSQTLTIQNDERPLKVEVLPN